MDALAFEPQFLDHLAPVWLAMPNRGRLLVASELVERAARLGLSAEPIDVRALKRTQPLPPPARQESGPIAFATSIGDIKIGRRLGYRRFIFMEHGAGQSYVGVASESYAGNKGREDVELFLCPNEYSAARFRATYPSAAVAMVGCPKLDTLPRRRLDPIESGPVVALSWHWPAAVAPEAGTAIGHYLRALPELAQRFHVIGHAHPKDPWPFEMDRRYRKLGIEFVPDFDEVCRRADVFVADNTSCLFEFASTGRPVVVLNCPAYRRNVNHGGRFWDWADIGIQVNEPAALLPAVEDALLDREEQQERREAVLQLVYQPRTNGAAYAVTAITDWLASREAVAA